MNQVEEYILEQESDPRELMLFLHQLIIEEYALKPKLSYGIPFYYRNRWVVYLNPKESGVEVAFTNGFRFKKYQDELEARGRKLIRSKSIENLKALNPRKLELWMIEALRVDDELAK